MIIKCSDRDYMSLSRIWERSVRASHDFLSENSIAEIKKNLISKYFPNVELYTINHCGRPTGFIGLLGDSIEMLFIDSDCRGQGYGSALIDFAKRNGATKVDVNEQNQSALNFYESKGFRIVGRDETDDAGRTYPILHLSL